MIGEEIKQRARLKGYMFEIIIMILLKENGYSEVLERNNKIREDRNRFIEVRGRGSWHQIDCLVDYNVVLPFLYPIRVFGEVKFHTNPTKKDAIREFIGVIKDIQENYFVPDSFNEPFNRVSELGVFFSASGFEAQAERLAFAHNIKTISYRNNFAIDRIVKLITEIERNYLYASKCISKGNFNVFFDNFNDLLDGLITAEQFKKRFDLANGIENIIYDLVEQFKSIKSSFIASTSAGVFIHFLGYDKFPDELFRDTDTQICEVYYLENRRQYYLEFTEDSVRRKFYFTPPKSLHEAAFYGGNIVLNEKERLFKSLHITKKINGLNRNISLKLNKTWLENVRNNLENRRY